MQLRFKSILNPKEIGYVWTNDSMSFWDQAYRARMPFHGAAGLFNTYGDGDVQHTPLSVVGPSHFTDYCVSLATYLLDNPGEEIRLHELESKADSCKERARFLATIQYKDEKRQWFNLSENKVSTSESKAHDKRWALVPTLADATIASAFRLHLWESQRSFHLLELYTLHDFYWNTLYSVVGSGDWEEKIVNYHKELPGDHRAAFNALQRVIQGREQLYWAKRQLDCAIANSTPKEKEVAA